ncbi:MAG: serine hydrolase [Rudaea sp.]|uniref:serine hydrolase n=1 Tax=Rudaea sp. TaxID=2136325 RepID=UPI0039E554F9
MRAAPATLACEAGAEPVPNEFSGTDIPSAQIDAAVAQVDAYAQKLFASSGIPGMAVAVVRDGKTVFAKGYGVRSLDTGVAVDADTVFQLASMSKSIGATVIAHQVGQGVVGWDTRVQKLMPAFKLSEWYATNNVTIGDLYAHRSGLPEHIADFLEDLGFDRAQMLDKLRYAPLAPFRTHYAYTNFGMTAAAEAVAIASGSDWATLSQQALYAPLGMSSTSSRYADFVARANRTVGHVKNGDRFVVTPSQRDPDAQSPAGGVSSSVNDVARWMNMVLAGGCANGTQLIPGAALLPATSPQIVSAAPSNPRSRAGFYGYGFNVGESGSGRVVLTHSGAFALGAATAYTLIPSADVGIVTLTNALPIGVPETLNADFADLVQFGRITQPWDELYAGAFKGILAPIGEHACTPKADGSFDCPAPPADATPAQPLARYAGTYANDFYGSSVISVDGDALKLRIGPLNATFDLSHWAGDEFLMIPPGESAMPGSRSTVAFANGTMTVEYMNEGDQKGLGVFRSTRRPQP